MTLTEPQQRWLDALESGEFKQGRGWLKGPSGYCCLGVACALYERETGRRFPRSTFSGHYAPTHATRDHPGPGSLEGALQGPYGVVKEWLGLRSPLGACRPPFGTEWYDDLAVANDDDVTFAAIARTVREHPDWFFVTPETAHDHR